MSEEFAQYNKTNPFFASITERYNLCSAGTDKDTYHVVLNLQGSGITYKVGDSVAVFSINDPEIVDRTLKVLRASGFEKVIDKHSSEEWILKDYLTKRANLVEVPRKLITEMLQRQSQPEKKKRLEFLFAEGQKESLKEYQASHEVWDALEENAEVSFTPQEFCHCLMPMLPRFYSIASSMQAVGEEIHLTVGELKYLTNDHLRHGVCTHYLCKLAPLNQNIVPLYLQSSHGFTLPEDPSIPIIMIGPGTGVAPYRAFMQERVVQKATGENWLFFGERHEIYNFFYKNYWMELVEKGMLRVVTAFSRDQEHKIYVQHRMFEYGQQLFELIEKGAMFYVCGDAHRMAKDVDAALHQIIQKHGNLDEHQAKDYVKRLKTEKRYLRDVY